MTTKEKFSDLCHMISNDSGHYDFWWEYIKIYEDDDDFQILENKITNFIKCLNENDVVWLSKDIENEIYHIV